MKTVKGLKEYGSNVSVVCEGIVSMWSIVYLYIFDIFLYLELR